MSMGFIGFCTAAFELHQSLDRGDFGASNSGQGTCIFLSVPHRAANLRGPHMMRAGVRQIAPKVASIEGGRNVLMQPT